MSGIQFSSPVTNQKASPAVYASSLATRPSPQLPGRIFVDTDNPSTGMYRDTGTVWVQLSSGSGTVPDLQTVCNVGFLTDTDMTFLYTNSADTSKIGFLNQAVGNFAFDIFKKANELFAIRALKPSTVDEEMELIFDAPGNTIKTSYNSLVTGINLDFFNNQFTFGDSNGNNNGIGLLIDETNRFAHLGDIQYAGSGTFLEIDDDNGQIETRYGGNGQGILLDFQFQLYRLGENYGANGSINLDIINNEIGIYDSSIFIGSNSGNNTLISLSDAGSWITTLYGGNDLGLKLDFTTNKFYLGSTTEYIGIDTTNNTLIAGANLTSASSGGYSGQHLKININGTNYKIELKNP